MKKNKYTISLPFNLKPHVKIECWSFYKFAIISHHKYFKQWLFNHYNSIYGDSYLHVNYGVNGTKFDQYNNFAELLEIKELSYMKYMSEASFVRMVKKCIANQEYVQVELNNSVLFNIENGTFDIHESVIIGYDKKEKQFLMTKLNQGSWIIIKKDFKIVFDAFYSRANMSKDELDPTFYRRLYLYPLSTYKLKKDTIIKPSISRFSMDIYMNVYNSSKIALVKDEGSIEIDSYYREGIFGSYTTLMEYVDKYKIEMKNPCDIHYKYPMYLKKLLEYRQLMKTKFLYAQNILKVPFSTEILASTSISIQKLIKCYFLAMKFEILNTNDVEILNEISINLYEVYKNDWVIFKHVLDVLLDIKGVY